MPENKRKEIVKKDLKTKTVYQFVDEENNIDVKSKEIFKNTNKVIHFPFKTNNGVPKFGNIEKIIYEDMPHSLPAGFIKSAKKGYGFTRELAPVLYSIQDKLPNIKQIIVSPNNQSKKIDNNTINFKYADLKEARERISPLLSKQSNEKKVLVEEILSGLLPEDFDYDEEEYEKGLLHNFIQKYDLTPEKLSDSDLEGISKIISQLPPNHEFIRTRKIISTKEKIDKVFLEDIVEQYSKILEQKTDTKRLEDKWQEFFNDNILYFNFGYVERFEHERIKGDKSLDIPDFILLNTYGYLDVFEIKTHLKPLLTYNDGRNNFYWTSIASQAISQAENYIDSIIKEEDTIIKNIRDEYDIHNIDAVRPIVYIIASSEDFLAGEKTNEYKGKNKKKLWNDFRRLNNSLKNIEFVLYDDLLDVFNNMLKRIKE